MTRAVRRRGEPEPPPASVEAARAEVGRALVRFAIAEAPAAIVLAVGLVWLYSADNGVSSEDRALWLVLALLAFLGYVAVLFLRILWPALRRLAAARRAET